MTKDELPELERLVLLAILHCGERAYGVPVMDEIRHRTGRPVLRPAVYEALRRLEGKGLVTARLGDPTPRRGGRARRFYAVTAPGLDSLKKARESWSRMWQGLDHIFDAT